MYSERDVEYHVIYLNSVCHVHEDLNEIYLNMLMKLRFSQ
jgi:hypothetical protein